MRRHLPLFLIVTAGISSVAWWLFGWRSDDNPTIGRITYQRTFGRCTKVSLDADRDGRADMEVRYAWADPYVGIVDGLCGDSFVSAREDRNLDGRWDTWTARIPPTRALWKCPLRIEADTRGLGSADWRREIAFGESEAVYSELKEIRGF